jgi:hypothetical protein
MVPETPLVSQALALVLVVVVEQGQAGAGPAFCLGCSLLLLPAIWDPHGLQAVHTPFLTADVVPQARTERWG